MLISPAQRAILTDFGLSRAVEEGSTGFTTSEGLKGTLRYLSPELVQDSTIGQSLESDIWAWACLVMEVRTVSLNSPHLGFDIGDLQVLADRIPYAEKKSQRSIIVALMKNERPSDANNLPIPVQALKDLLANCWAIQPKERPSARHCLRVLATESSTLKLSTHLDG